MAALLSACVALTPQSSQATSFTLNSSSNANVAINSSTNWTTIRSAVMSAQNHSHSCMTVASGDVDNPGGSVADQQYIFTVSIDNNNPITDGAAERTLELRDNATIDDPNIKPVATNDVFHVAANVSHTFRFLGRKVGAAANTSVLDSTLSVVCVDD